MRRRCRPSACRTPTDDWARAVVEHSPAPRPARLGPLAEPQFRRLYLARAFSLFGDALVPVALAFAVLAVDRSPTALGFVLASRFVSLVVFLLVGGVIGDRLSRKGVLIASDLVRFGAQSITAWLLITAHARVWELVALAFVYGMGEAFFRPTSTGFVPETVSQARLQQANALLAMTTSTWTVVGPVVAGVMVTTVGAGWAIGADALTFLVSALFVWQIRTSRPLLGGNRRSFATWRTGGKSSRHRPGSG